MTVFPEGILKKYIDTDKFGLISPEFILKSSQVDILTEFAIQHSISVLVFGDDLKDRLIETIITYFFTSPAILEKIKQTRFDIFTNLGEELRQSSLFKGVFQNFDFISEIELENSFADWCADINITVYKPKSDDEYGMQLYLTKKDPTLKTESVFVLTGLDSRTKYNEELFENIKKAGKVSDWKVFVTTPLAVLEIGYEKLLNNMKELDCWTYIVDPFHRRILGLTKGNKSKEKNQAAWEEYNRNIPTQPIRAPSQVVKLSKYIWSERDAYNPKKILPYYITYSQESAPPVDHKYSNIFRSLLLITKENGMLLYSHSNPDFHISELMLSGFLSAIDTFIQEVGGGTGLQEINYQNFKINSHVGENIRTVVITSQSVDDAFRERLRYLTYVVENEFQKSINLFIETGNVDGFKEEDVLPVILDLLLIE